MRRMHFWFLLPGILVGIPAFALVPPGIVKRDPCDAAPDVALSWQGTGEYAGGVGGSGLRVSISLELRRISSVEYSGEWQEVVDNSTSSVCSAALNVELGHVRITLQRQEACFPADFYLATFPADDLIELRGWSVETCSDGFVGKIRLQEAE